MIGAQQTYDYFRQIQDRITGFVCSHCSVSKQRMEEMMIKQGMLSRDLGTILVGEQAVYEGIISSVGGIREAVQKLHELADGYRAGRMKKKNSNPVGALKRTGAYMSSGMGIIIFALVLAALSAAVIATSAIKSFVEVAKVDHLVFKFEVYKAFMGASGKSAEEFSSHTTCRLGKWLRDAGRRSQAVLYRPE